MDLNYSLIDDFEFNTTSNSSVGVSVLNGIETSFSIIVFLVGITANTMVCCVVGKRKMRTPFNIFLATLAIADILYCLFIVPAIPIYRIYDRWILGKAMCVVTFLVSDFYMFYTPIAISIILLLNRKINLAVSYVAICGILFVATSFALPRVFVSELVMDENDNVFCVENFPNASFRLVYVKLRVVTNILIPFLTIIISFIVALVVKSNKDCPADRLRLVMMFIHILCWSPVIVLESMINVDPSQMYLFVLVNLISLLSVVYKPILCFFMDKNLSMEFLELVSCCKTRQM